MLRFFKKKGSKEGITQAQSANAVAPDAVEAAQQGGRRHGGTDGEAAEQADMKRPAASTDEGAQSKSPPALRKQASDAFTSGGNSESGSDSSSDSDDDLGDVDDLVDISEDAGMFSGDNKEDKEREEREEIVRTNFDVLCQVPFFAQFPKEHQMQLFEELRVERYKDGDLIVQQGDKGDRMYVILDGEAVVWRVEKDNESRDITHLYSHDYFGELALVYGQARNSNVSSIGNTTVMYLSKDGFEKFEKIRVFMIAQKIPMLSKLRLDMQIKIVRKLKAVIIERGECVVKQGEVGDAFYMISKGSAVVEENGEVSTHLYEGHTFGQMALLSGAPRLASVRAKEQLICMMLKAKDFKELTSEENEFNQILTSDDQVIRRRRSKRDARKNKTRHVAGSFDSQGRRMSLDSGQASGLRNRGSAASLYGSPNASDMSSGAIVERSRRGSVGASSMSSSSFTLSGGQQLIENSKVDKSSRGGRKVINGFVLQKEIGRGTFGKVRLCVQERTGERFAIKIIDKSHINRDKMSVHVPGMSEMREEVAIMKRLLHPNIVNLAAVIDDPAADYLYIVTEYCENGAIMNGLEDNEPLSEAVARKYFRDVLLGLQYLHFAGVIHRDIKPMNLLLTADKVVKIADFGAARMIVGGTKWVSGVTGTPAFMAPELLVEDSDVYDGPAVDLWSCGATLFMFVTGSPPWMSDDEINLSKKVKNDELLFPSDWNRKNYSPHLKNLISQLLEKLPKDRLTLEATMNHDWVTEEGSEELIGLDGSSAPDLRPISGEAAIDQLELLEPSNSPPSSARSRPKSSSGRSGHADELDNFDGIEGVVSVEESDDFASDEESEYSENNQYDFHRNNRPKKKSSSAAAGGNTAAAAAAARRATPAAGANGADGAGGAGDEPAAQDVMEPIEGGPGPIRSTRGGTQASWIGARFASELDQNVRSKMEDTVSVVPKLTPPGRDSFLGVSGFGKSKSKSGGPVFFAGVFDGHGGKTVSEKLRSELHKVIASQDEFPDDLEEAVRRGCLEMDRSMLQRAATHLHKHRQKVSAGTLRHSLARTKGDRNGKQTLESELQRAGSTAVMVLLTLNEAADRRTLHAAWVGDSRAVMSRNGRAFQLSEDHKASREDEKERIRQAGGTVNRKGQVDGALAVSRSFGDIQHVGHELPTLMEMQPSGRSPKDDELLESGIVIPKPDQRTVPLESTDEFVILASDGLWDVITNQGAVNLVRRELARHHDLQAACKALIRDAAERSVDNISIVLVAL